MDTTTGLETMNVTVQKIHGLDNQQPSPCEMGKVQRLSGNAEYTQAGGKRGHLVHVCRDCGTGDITKFGLRSPSRKPYNHCRVCRQKRNIETQRKYAQQPEVKAKKSVADQVYAQQNSETISEYQKQYRAANRDSLIEATRQRYQKNKEDHLAKAAEWKRNNAGIVNQTCMKRHAAKMNRVPAWLSKDDKAKMEDIYGLCRTLNRNGMVKYHVDHILPLQGKTVSGLHMPSNMQIIPASVNCSKQNKVDNIVCSA
jgi:hypothetical protein